MDSVMLIMILPLFLTMMATNGQPSGCTCYNGGVVPACYARGCSLGNNPSCNNGYFGSTGGDHGFSFSSFNFLTTHGYTGCNCPGYSFFSINGFYRDLSSRNGYNYDTCTSYGLNARDHNGDVPGGANDAIDCCNYCCNRNDPYHPTIVTTIKTIPTTTITNTVPTTTRSTTTFTNTVPITTKSTTTIPTATTTTFRQPDGCDCVTGGYYFAYYSGGSSCSGSRSCSSCLGCSGGSCCSGVSSCCITDCCNYCCNRPDPDTTTKPTSTAISTTINTTTIAATSGDREIILNKSLYLSALTMLVLATLKIN